MKLIISSLRIENFRSLKRLELENLARVNLITGRNNTGKSSLLEALRIMASDAAPSMLNAIARNREEDYSESEDSTRGAESEGLLQIGSLFTGFPQVADIREPIVLEAPGNDRALGLSLSVKFFTEERQEDGSKKFVPQQPELFPSEGLMPPDGLIAALVTERTGRARRVIPVDLLKRSYLRNRIWRLEVPEEVGLPCAFVSSYGNERTSNVGHLWDKIALSDLENDIVDALQLISPDIMAVSMVGVEGNRTHRTAIVKSSRFPRPIPLRSYGDGLNRLFSIALSLVNAKGGLLLIDEFENGMHHTVQLDVWKAIFRLSTALNIQVFATTHSWDAVRTFQEAAAADPEEGSLIRLARYDDIIVPTIFREDELAIVTRESVEVR
ncbi:MAG: AAA family ATPase [Verrucomicrobiales bacterium]|nr:AAA family ATPase [Verrucomicrobiales bacterium]